MLGLGEREKWIEKKEDQYKTSRQGKRVVKISSFFHFLNLFKK